MQQRVVVVDDFYRDPDRLRSLAVKAAFRSAGNYNYPGWQSDVAMNADSIQGAFEGILGHHIRVDTSRYTWGGFRLITEETGRMTKVHADQAVDWAALVYLTPEAPMDCGTGFFRHRSTGLATPPSDREARQLGYEDAAAFELEVTRPEMGDLSKWELIGAVAPLYNRLVMFRGCEFYHAPLGGCGSGPVDGRLTHSFFFDQVEMVPDALV